VFLAANHKMYNNDNNNNPANAAAVKCWMFIIIMSPTNATYTTTKEGKEPVIHKRDKPIQAAPKQTDTQPNPTYPMNQTIMCSKQSKDKVSQSESPQHPTPTTHPSNL
jgi:hypothetical protein